MDRRQVMYLLTFCFHFQTGLMYWPFMQVNTDYLSVFSSVGLTVV